MNWTYILDVEQLDWYVCRNASNTIANSSKLKACVSDVYFLIAIRYAHFNTCGFVSYKHLARVRKFFYISAMYFCQRVISRKSVPNADLLGSCGPIHINIWKPVGIRDFGVVAPRMIHDRCLDEAGALRNILDFRSLEGPAWKRSLQLYIK